MERPPDFVEVHWGDGFQAFVTPVSANEVGVAMTTDLPSLSIVVPVHNEAGNVGALAAEIRSPARARPPRRGLLQVCRCECRE